MPTSRKYVIGVLAIGILAILAGGIILNVRRNQTPPDTNLPGNTIQTDSVVGVLTIQAQLIGTEQLGNNIFAVHYLYTLTNGTNHSVSTLSVINSLASTFGSSVFTITGVSSPSLTLNSGFNGRTVTDMLSGNNVLTPNQTATISLDLTLDPQGFAGPYENAVSIDGVLMPNATSSVTSSRSSSSSRSSAQGGSTTSSGSGVQTATSTSSSTGSSSSSSSSNTPLINNLARVSFTLNLQSGAVDQSSSTSGSTLPSSGMEVWQNPLAGIVILFILFLLNRGSSNARSKR